MQGASPHSVTPQRMRGMHERGMHELQHVQRMRPASAHARTQQYMQRTINLSGLSWWITRLDDVIGPPGGGHETKVLASPVMDRVPVSPPKRPVSARAYLRQPPDATSADTWTAAAENLGRYSNRMPIDPLRIARAHNGSESHCSGKRRPHTARTPPGSTGRKTKGGLDFNFGRTPSIAQTMVSKPANEGGGRASGKKVPKYAEYQSMGSIPSVSRASMSMVGDGGNHTQARRNKLRWNASLAATAPGSLLGQNIPGSPMAVGGLESPIYIEKHLVAEWTSDSTMHPLLLSKRPKGWSATPIEAVPKGSHDLTAAKLATTKSRMRHMITNEFPPSIRSFFLDGLDSEKESESDSDSESVPPTPKEGGKVSKGPDPACAGNGLVQANDDRCKVGTKVKIAFSFCTEEWAAHLVGKVGKLVERSPFTSGTWRVKFPGVRELIDCSVGLMGRYHLVYAEEDAFADEEAQSPNRKQARSLVHPNSNQSIVSPLSSPLRSPASSRMGER